MMAHGKLEVNQYATLTFTWKIEDYYIFFVDTKVGEFIISPDFKVLFDEGNFHLFNLKLYPNGNVEANKDYLSLKLLDNGSNHPSVPLDMIHISLINGENDIICCEKLMKKQFTKNNHITLDQFCENKILFDPKNRALLNQILIIQLHVNFNLNLHHATDTIFHVNPVNNLIKNYKSRGYEDFEQLLDDEKLSDVKFKIGDKTIYSHRAILISRSKVFQAMLEHPMIENQNGKVEITDIKYEVMKELLRFLYASKVNEIDEIAGDLLVAADKYSIDDLKALCETSLYDTLNCDNAIRYLILTSSCKTIHLKSQVIQFINDHPGIVNQPEFKTMDSDIMYDVVRAMANKRMKY